MRKAAAPFWIPVGTTLLIAAALWFTWPKTPALSAVNGVYVHQCCGSVELRDGTLIANGVRLPFTLEMTKVGLAADPSTPIEVRNGRIEARPDAVTKSIVFTHDRTAFSVCAPPGCATEYQFRRR